jgi:hypothetical protein
MSDAGYRTANARGAQEVFQPLEKKFPIIGKNGAIFPTIGKKLSNHWKKAENFFQSLENRRKYFPIVGKLWRSFHVCRVRVNTIYPIVGIILTPIREKGAAA